MLGGLPVSGILNETFRFTGKPTGCPGFPVLTGGGEGGNGLQHWSQSRPCNPIYNIRKPRPVPACGRQGRRASICLFPWTWNLETICFKIQANFLTRSAAPSPVFEDGVKERGSGSTLSPSATLRALSSSKGKP